MNPAVKYRSLGLQFLIAICTCGLYIPYWYYQTTQELAALSKSSQPEQPVVLWTILLFVPPLFLYSYFKQGELFEKISPEYNRWLILALWVFFSPAVWIIIQLKLNHIARQPLVAATP